MKRTIEYFTIEEARANFPHRALIISRQNDKILVECQFCDVCGEDLIDIYGNVEGIAISQCWGFESNKDLERHELDLCEKCYDKELLQLVKKFGRISEYY